MRPDPRIAYGAFCTWWDSIDNVGQLPNGLPCCPQCRHVLYEIESERQWWDAVTQYTAVEPNYREFITWMRGKCYPNYLAARAAWVSEAR